MMKKTAVYIVGEPKQAEHHLVWTPAGGVSTEQFKFLTARGTLMPDHD